MILIGMFDSPFVRRAAVSMKLLGLPFEHRNWSVGRDFERIRQYNPLGRVPTLVLDDGECLVDSAAILDFLDDQVGPARALLPPTGPDRREAQRLMAIAIGAAEKGALMVYEHAFRPAEKCHEPWLDRLRTQLHGALGELERSAGLRAAHAWLVGNRVTQADVTVTCAFTFLVESQGLSPDVAPYPRLRAHVARCEALPEFAATRAAWFAPAG